MTVMEYPHIIKDIPHTPVASTLCFVHGLFDQIMKVSSLALTFAQLYDKLMCSNILNSMG